MLVLEYEHPRWWSEEVGTSYGREGNFILPEGFARAEVQS